MLARLDAERNGRSASDRVISFGGRAGLTVGLLLVLLFVFPVVSSAALAPPITIDGGHVLYSVACPSLGQCTAVDASGNEVTFNPTSPGAPTPTATGTALLYNVACPSVSQCTAVDGGPDEVTFNPTSPGAPTPITIDGGHGLKSIACPSVSQCTAVDYSGREVTFNPSSPGAPTPIAIDGGHGLYRVACPSVSQCTAIDIFGHEVTFDPTSPGAPTPIAISTALNSIACPSMSQCTAVDYGGHEVTFSPTSPGAATPITIDSGPFILYSIACPSVSQCTAVDISGQEATFDPTSPGAPTPITIDGGHGLYSVACPSSSQCTAIDGSGREVTFNPTSPGTTVPVSISPPSSLAITRVGQTSPSASHASLSGVAQGRAKLSFTLAAGKNAATLKTITVALPKGLGFSSSKKNLAKGILLRAGGRTLKFTANVTHGKLTITLRIPASSAQVTISSPAITVSKKLAKNVKTGKVKTLSVLVTATDTGHTTTRITLRLRAR